MELGPLFQSVPETPDMVRWVLVVGMFEIDDRTKISRYPKAQLDAGVHVVSVVKSWSP